jgi:hypothetical protein
VHQILRPSAQSQVPAITATASSNFKVLAASVRWFTLVALESNSSATSPLPFYTFSQCIDDINFFFASFQFTIDSSATSCRLQQNLEASTEKTAQQISV